MLSPISGVFEITRDRSWSGRPARAAPEHWAAIGLVWIVATLLWSAALARRANAKTTASNEPRPSGSGKTPDPTTKPEPRAASPEDA
jgi:hypothetical protein